MDDPRLQVGVALEPTARVVSVGAPDDWLELLSLEDGMVMMGCHIACELFEGHDVAQLPARLQRGETLSFEEVWDILEADFGANFKSEWEAARRRVAKRIDAGWAPRRGDNSERFARE